MQPRRTARQAAMNLLARREHSALELRDKLLLRGFEAEEIGPALQALSHEGLLSDERFAEAFVHSRTQRGIGPVKIQLELRQRGVADSLIQLHLDEQDAAWLARGNVVRKKKFGNTLPTDYKECARQARFLQYRGFTAEQIRQVMRDEEI